jgi:hypothetical protein
VRARPRSRSDRRAMREARAPARGDRGRCRAPARRRRCEIGPSSAPELDPAGATEAIVTINVDRLGAAKIATIRRGPEGRGQRLPRKAGARRRDRANARPQTERDREPESSRGAPQSPGAIRRDPREAASPGVRPQPALGSAGSSGASIGRSSEIAAVRSVGRSAADNDALTIRSRARTISSSTRAGRADRT